MGLPVAACEQRNQTRRFDPFQLERRGDELHGRGTSRCFGHVALLVHFLHELAQNRPRLNHKIVVVFFAGYEGGESGIGADGLLEARTLDCLKNGPVFWLGAGGSAPCMSTTGTIGWTIRAKGLKDPKGCTQLSADPLPKLNSMELAWKTLNVIQAGFNENFTEIGASSPSFTAQNTIQTRNGDQDEVRITGILEVAASCKHRIAGQDGIMSRVENIAKEFQDGFKQEDDKNTQWWEAIVPSCEPQNRGARVSCFPCRNGLSSSDSEKSQYSSRQVGREVRRRFPILQEVLPAPQQICRNERRVDFEWMNGEGNAVADSKSLAHELAKDLEGVVLFNTRQNSACHVATWAFNDVERRSSCRHPSFVNIRGSIPHVRRFQDAGFDVQLFGFGLHQHLHDEDEHCLLDDMRKGYQVLLSIIKFIESGNGENGRPHQRTPAGCGHEADSCAGWPKQDQLKPDPPMQDLQVQNPVAQGPTMQVPFMQEHFLQHEFTQELRAQGPPMQSHSSKKALDRALPNRKRSGRIPSSMKASSQRHRHPSKLFHEQGNLCQQKRGQILKCDTSWLFQLL